MRAGWDHGGIVVRGSDRSEAYAVVPVEALHLGADLVPTAGSWRREDDVARFTPRFALVGGTTYAVIVREDADEGWRELARTDVPRTSAARTTVAQSIDPGGTWIPANVLRFSVTFSAEMEEGSADGRIHLRDSSGADVPGALFSMTPEFWDRERRRLTILLEPGRIKRGLRPNLLAGPPLVEGSTVTLVVDPQLRDASGAELAAEAHRTYSVRAAIRERVDPARWDIRWPDAGQEQFVLRFDRPLDRALVRRCLRLIDERGRPVAGHSMLDADASVWTFTPVSRFSGLRLQIDTRLEDLAGNSVRRVFERDLQRADGNDSIGASHVLLDSDGSIDF